MHTRKKFLIYPPEYKPGDGYKIRYSKLQAWKVAVKLGAGAFIDEEVYKHPKRCHAWTSSRLGRLWETVAPPDKVLKPALEIAKATDYMEATREQFAANAEKAKRCLQEPESGALAGPIENQLLILETSNGSLIK